MKLPIMTTEPGGTSTAVAPDVCMTLVGVATVPIPYPNIARHGDGSGSQKVTVEGKEVMRVGDEVARTSGDEPGNAPGGVVSGRFSGKAAVETTPQIDVKVEGKRVAVPGSMTGQNAAGPSNTVGAVASVTQKAVQIKIGNLVFSKRDHPLNEAAKALECSPTLMGQLYEFCGKGWEVEWGPRGKGTGVKKSKGLNRPPQNMTVEMDPGMHRSAESIANALAHEMGHAFDGLPMIIYQPGMTRASFVNTNVCKQLLSEGKATMNQLRVRDEMLKSDDPDCWVAADDISDEVQEELEDIYEDEDMTDDEKETAMGILYKDYPPSGGGGKTYEEYYADNLGKIFDAHFAN